MLVLVCSKRMEFDGGWWPSDCNSRGLAGRGVTRDAPELAFTSHWTPMLSRCSEQPRLPERPIRASAANLHGALSPPERHAL